MGCLKIILIFATILSATYGSAATYYVDYAGGSDSANGTSTSTPLKRCPGDNNYSPSGDAPTALVAGDVVIFKGGVSYYGTIDLDWSGASNESRIIYDGDSGTYALRWGSGTNKAIIDGQNTRAWGIYFSSAKNYITIKNFEIRNTAHVAQANSNGGIGTGSSAGSSTGITIADCYIHTIGVWQNDGTARSDGSGVVLFRAVDLIISGTEITKANYGIRLWGSQNGTITQNDIHDYIIWGIAIGSSYAAASGNTISENKIYNLFYHDTGYWTGDPADVPHTNSIFIMSTGSYGRVNDTVITRNLFYNNETFDSYGGTSMVYDQGESSLITNNVFINWHTYRAIDNYVAIGSKIYNNTFYSTRPYARSYYSGASSTTATIKNNILTGGELTAVLGFMTATDAGAVVSNTNIFFSAGNTAIVGSPYTAYAALSAWRSAYGEDANSIAVAALADIKFVDTTGYPTACETMDLRLQADSPARNGGEDLSAIFSDDYLGNSRAAWDIGAYEYGSGTPTLTIPAGWVSATGNQIQLTTSESAYVGTGGSGGFTLSASGGAATLTYSSGSGTTTLTYTTSRTIYQGETISLSYTQPGDGIEGGDGDDLSSFSSMSLTNNSLITSGFSPTSAVTSTNGNSLSVVFSSAVQIGSGGSGGVALSASDGSVVPTYSSGSGTTTLVYTLSRTLYFGETITLDYAQPSGGNGIELVSNGTDASSITDFPVTNSSTVIKPPGLLKGAVITGGMPTIRATGGMTVVLP